MSRDDNVWHQAVIAREIINIYRDAQDKLGVSDSLDVLCFAMARLIDYGKLDNPSIDWDELSGCFDMVTSSENEKDIKSVENDIDLIYRKIVKITEK